MINEYIRKVSIRYKTGISREHSYRGDLQTLLESIAPDVLVTNEPAHIACGAPDYIITKKNIPIGYIEAKDIGKPLYSKDYKEQFDRYKKSLDNLIITDYLDFLLYRDREFITSIKIASIENGRIVPITDNFDSFSDLIKDFCTHISQTIKSASKLSKMMAGKARLLAKVIESTLTSDEENEADSSLKAQMLAFKDVLIHDISPTAFADIYAQTIAYGMFAARLHDPTLEDFSRQEAAELIPKSNPFLRRLFGYIAGPNIDERIKWIVDALADIFRAADVKAILNTFGESTQTRDPLIHFYETFLAEYDPKLRKSRGVYYTPEPVVNFIVRAVDDILINEFHLPKGLADTSQVEIEVETQGSDNRRKDGKKKALQKVHKVQILDPAAGTGTFLAEVVNQIYDKFQGQQGIWSQYVDEQLIPRLNGFELLMASYSMAHLKLFLLLRATGYKSTKQQRFQIYLTNSLEEHHPDTGTLFASWLSSEANEANHIKRDTPVMCVIGNPPYSVSSSNKSEWIEKLMVDYKKNLNERNINPLSDDYIKFIRYGQYFIEKNGEGILAYISNNSFIDGIIHRQMRKNLLETFDKIYILNLHGNAKKKEVCLDGSSDKNVFDIMQGVSINIFVKTNKTDKKTLADVNHSDLFGLRNDKYNFLTQNSIVSIKWKKLVIRKPTFFFIPVNYELYAKYSSGFDINILFNKKTSGVKTHNDKELVSFNRFDTEFNYSYGYKPFDNRYINYDLSKVVRHRFSILKNVYGKENMGLVLMRKLIDAKSFNTILISNILIDINFYGFQTYFFPLYLYSETNGQQNLEGEKIKTPNLKPEIVKQIAENISLTFTPEKKETEGTFAPIDILDYIYSVLHSPSYREKYKEFLKMEFPRVPYPKDQDIFWQLVKLGDELRQIHLLESSQVEKYVTTYPNDGDNTVTRRINQKDLEIIDEVTVRVWINDQQYFDKVPKIAWEFYIGGYQPAQKWLKDRHGRTLSYEDILHYQKIIVALTETDRIMKEIDKIEFE